MGQTLLGTAPSAQFSTQPTILPQQQDLLSQLSTLLSTGQNPAGVQAYGGQFAAPLQNIQNSSLQGLENIANQVPTAPTGQQTNATGDAFNTLTKSLNYQAPQIDATKAFQSGVVEPMTDDFLQRILPSISGKYGASAGGAYSSDAQKARGQAGTDLERTLSQAGSTFAYNAAQSNQSADVASNAARLSALGQTPSIAGLPGALQSLDIGNLMQTLSAGSVPYNQAQTQVSGQYQDFLNQQAQRQSYLSDYLGGFGSSTVSTNGVGSGGSTGLIQALLGNAGLGAAAGKYVLSDERVKENFERVGDVEGLPLYRFNYKDDATKTRVIGVKAQEAEKRVPSAVIRLPDRARTRAVDYAALIEGLMKEAA